MGPPEPAGWVGEESMSSVIVMPGGVGPLIPQIYPEEATPGVSRFPDFPIFQFPLKNFTIRRRLAARRSISSFELYT
jgi:hypothetical protein